MECPVCSRKFPSNEIENHVDLCLFNESDKSTSTFSNKRIFPFTNGDKTVVKKVKIQQPVDTRDDTTSQAPGGQQKITENTKPKTISMFSSTFRHNNDNKMSLTGVKDHQPLAESLRPVDFNDYIGQKHVIGGDTVLGQLMMKNEVISMILWGPPGCGKTSLANIIAKMTPDNTSITTKFIKMSATSSGISDIRRAVTTALDELKKNRRTVVFMDEIHRFNKLQQDIFLPHVEAGTFILIGSTTENPSFSLNSALLSRCRVFSLKKLSPEDIQQILQKGVQSLRGKIIQNDDEEHHHQEFVIQREAVNWLSNACDGDARIALTGLELTIKSRGGAPGGTRITLDDVKGQLERAYSLSVRKTDRNQDIVAAMAKCIRNSHSNGALYWLARLMATGEDPVFIGKRLIRIAGEHVGLDDPEALDTAVHTMNGCQMIGMPECDVLLAQCVCYLCKVNKSKVVNSALRRVQNVILNHKGPQPSVPIFIRDTSSQRRLQVTIGQNLLRLDDKSRNHLPLGLEGRNFLGDDDDDDDDDGLEDDTTQH
ncbi:ATPase WRNIP1-like [Diachasmimorpha longicaudata]|uniref:ATPase WRNIP1-like n=1 Tax=Diachasmimorpha longicaudata TaxID=58733 RepID=UPI0030B8ABE2